MNDPGHGSLADVLLRAVEQSPSIVVITDLKGNIEYVNPMFCQLTGYTRNEILGKSTRVLKSGKVAPSVYANLWAKLTAGADWQGEFLNRKKSGELYWEAAVISAIRSPKGPVERYLKVAEDITSQKALEDELKASQERYERVVMAMRGFVFTVLMENGKPVRTVHYPCTQEVTGYTAAEYHANPALWFSMIVEEDRAAVTRQIEAVENEKKTYSVEHRILHKNGAIRWLRNVSVPTLDEKRQLTSYDGLVTDITELKEAEAQRDRLLDETQRLATRDALTGLYSRRVFDDELNRAWQIGERRGLPLSLLMLDLDHFKVLNDTYGHQVGDQVLTEASRLIRSTVRAGDTVVRYGGDEIVVILPLTGIEETHRAGERLLDAFRRHTFCQGIHDLRTTVSIGAASGTGSGQPAPQILMRADQALYRAKQSGSNMLCLSEPDSTSQFITVGNMASGAVAVADTGKPDGAGKGRILVVDDEPEICRVVCALLEKENYSVAVALDANGARAIAEDERGQIDVALVDLRLAEHNGLDVLKQLRLIDDTLIGIVMTGYATVDNSTAAMRIGAVDFIQKPITAVQLAPAIERAMKYRRFLKENRIYQRHIEKMLTERSVALSKALSHVTQSRHSTVAVLAALFEAHEKKTGEHCKRVAQMAQMLAREMQVTVEDVEMIGYGGLLHDIGKIGIPDTILLKQGALTEDEWRIVKSHPQIGYEVVRLCPALEEAAAIIFEHHEHFDGSGYPRGLKGDAICTGARIFAVADTYDAIRSNRPYSPARGEEEATAEIIKNRGVLFDPAVVDAFLRCQPRLEGCITGGPCI
jgi:diguanylate cyclase (GGDEF)-like protein/PAS domain S-box-containing protein/putative nucleotidyltransferase with HDIG domain